MTAGGEKALSCFVAEQLLALCVCLRVRTAILHRGTSQSVAGARGGGRQEVERWLLRSPSSSTRERERRREREACSESMVVAMATEESHKRARTMWRDAVVKGNNNNDDGIRETSGKRSGASWEQVPDHLTTHSPIRTFMEDRLQCRAPGVCLLLRPLRSGGTTVCSFN